MKQAFATGLVSDGQLWIDMLEERNLMAHTYDDMRARQAVRLIQERYLTGPTAAAGPVQRQAGKQQVMPNQPVASMKQAVAQTQNTPHGKTAQPAPVSHGLSEPTVTEIRHCLQEQFPQVHGVKLYGSRAMGRHCAGSDIDLAFSADEDCSAALGDALDQLPTPSPIDVTHWESLRYPALREHRERVGKAVPTWANHHSR